MEIKFRERLDIKSYASKESRQWWDHLPITQTDISGKQNKTVANIMQTYHWPLERFTKIGLPPDGHHPSPHQLALILRTYNLHILKVSSTIVGDVCNIWLNITRSDMFMSGGNTFIKCKNIQDASNQNIIEYCIISSFSRASIWLLQKLAYTSDFNK